MTPNDLLTTTPEPLFATDWLWKLSLIFLFFLLAWFLQRFSGRVANLLLRIGRLTSSGRRMRQERRDTLHGLLSSTIAALAVIVASFASVGLFVNAANLVWLVGLFSAAFGLGARPLVSDFLSGMSFIFGDTFEVGEKVEMPIAGSGTIEGIIEEVNLRLTQVRSPTGELYTIPNGEIRVVRNFSRGRFSTADITLKIAAADLPLAIPLLERLGKEAVAMLPNLLEPWQVVSPTGELSTHTELILVTKARFGKAAEMRPRLLSLVQEQLARSDIHVTS